MLTAAEIGARTARAVGAATAAGRELGLSVTEPQVLYDVFSVIVHLAPAPVVARVPAVLPRTVATAPDAQVVQQRTELAVTAWLADRGHPVVPPSPLVPREPFRRDGFSMTFWQFVEQVRQTDPSAARHAKVTAQLHAALGEYSGELRFLVPLDESIPDGLAELEQHPGLLTAADLERAQREWTVLRPLVRSRAALESAFPHAGVQAIHGDAPFYNIIVTPAGELCADFEHVCLGPVKWDLVGIGPEGRAAYDAAAIQLGLRPLDERLFRVMESARMLQSIACLALVPQLPILAEGLRPVLDQWRRTPLPEGLGDGGEPHRGHPALSEVR
jgi:thiamine kinase-like enzyme